MTIQVTGTLTDSGGNPAPNAHILFRTSQGFAGTLASAELNIITDATGKYNFSLAIGVHLISVRYGDGVHSLGKTIINSETPSPLTLSDLLNQTEPLLPEEITQVNQMLTEVRQIYSDAQTLGAQVSDDAEQVVTDKLAIENMRNSVDEVGQQVSNNAAIVVASANDVENARQEVEVNMASVQSNKDAVVSAATQVESSRQEVATNTTLVQGFAQSASTDAARAEAAALTASSGIRDRGPWDASTGNFPVPTLEPEEKTDWYRISVAGVMSDGVQPDVDVDVGDNLYWDQRADVWYKIDNTDKVNSVNGKEGDVVLVADDIDDVYSKTEVLQITDPLGTRVTDLESTVDSHEITLDGHETRITELESGLSGANNDLAALNESFANFYARYDTSVAFNGWYGATNAAAFFQRTGNMVTMYAAAENVGAAPEFQNLFTIPLGYRPAMYQEASASVINNGYTSRLLLFTNGLVQNFNFGVIQSLRAQLTYVTSDAIPIADKV